MRTLVSTLTVTALVLGAGLARAEMKPGDEAERSNKVQTPGSIYEFNPQPEPPRIKKKLDPTNPAARGKLAGQPEAPSKTQEGLVAVPGGELKFNPQPEPPPKEALGEIPAESASGPQTPGSIYEFNPQPEPPKVAPLEPDGKVGKKTKSKVAQ